MPGMSSEEKVHPGSQSQNHCELVRTGPAGGAGTGEDPSLPAVETRTEQGRSALFGTEAAGGITACTITSALERGRTVLFGGDRPESETAGAVADAAGARPHPLHRIRDSTVEGNSAERID